MANKVRYGLKNAHYAVITDTAGVITFGTPVKLPGAVNITLDPKGEKVEFYADDSAYFVAEKNDGYEGDLEIALVPDSFLKDVLGYKQDTNGALFEDANAIAKKIALLYEFSGDANATRHVLYDVVPGRSAIAGQTKEAGIEVQTATMPMTAGPASDSGYVKAKAEQGTVAEPNAVYEGWFSNVYKFVPPVG